MVTLRATLVTAHFLPASSSFILTEPFFISLQHFINNENILITPGPGLGLSVGNIGICISPTGLDNYAVCQEDLLAVGFIFLFLTVLSSAPAGLGPPGPLDFDECWEMWRFQS